MSPEEKANHTRELFGQALELPSAERDAFLQRQCAGDEALLKELCELLDLDSTNNGFLQTPRASMGLGGIEWLATELAAEEARNECVPQNIGGFQVVREIGRGGMGIVYEAKQHDPERSVAIKVVHPGVLSPSTIQRFRQETRVLAQLKHPGIVQVFDAGSTSSQDGVQRPYLVMEFVEGTTIRDFVRLKNPSIRQRLTLLAMICDAVNHAHQRGVVHRDLKPDNILIEETAQPRTGVSPINPKILDFGVCRLMEADQSSTPRTMVGQVVGTVPYLSPEQAQGDISLTDTRSDVYSLGVIAYELLCGSLPFEVGDRPLSQVIATIQNQSPIRLGDMNPELRGDVETIVQKAMSKDPSQRYQSAGEFADDIRRYLANEPVSARPPSLTYIAGRFIRRHRVLSGIVAASLTMLVLSLVLITLFWSRATTARAQAVWQNYVANMGAASLSIAEGDIAAARRQLEATPLEHRGWEFDHFWSRLDDSRMQSDPEGKPPFSVVTLDDPTALILLSSNTIVRRSASTPHQEPERLDDRLRLWYGAQASRLPEDCFIHQRTISWLDSNGQLVSKVFADLPGESLRVSRARVSQDKYTLAFFGIEPHDVNVFIANLQRGTVVKSPRQPDLWPNGLAITSDGLRAVYGVSNAVDADCGLWIVDANDGSVIDKLRGLPSKPFSMVFAPDGHRLYCVMQNGALDAWDVSSVPGKLLVRRDFVHDGSINLCVSPDGSTLASGSRDMLVRVFQAETLEHEYDLKGHGSEVRDVCFTKDSKSLISTDTDGSLRVWDVRRPPERPVILRGHTHLVHPMAISTQRNQLVTGSWDATVALFSLETGERVRSAPVSHYVIGLSLSPDETIIATREFLGPTRIWNAETLTEIGRLDQEVKRLDQPLFDLTSKRLVVDIHPEEGTMDVWDLRTLVTTVVPMKQLSDFVGPVLNHSESLIAFGAGEEGRPGIAIRNYESGELVFSQPARRSAVETVSFSQDGKLFASQDLNNQIHIYDARTKKKLKTCKGHSSEVLCTVFSHNATRLFSADLTGTIRIWDVATGSEVGQLRGHQSHVRRLLISADGRSLISGSRDGTARVWSAP